MPRRLQQLFLPTPQGHLSSFPAEGPAWASGARGHLHRVTVPGPHPLPGHALAQMGLASSRRPRWVPERKEASWAPSQCLSVPVSPHPPSQPWHSNQCPLTSHLAISVNQLKLARCHKNIYTFYSIGKFKSSSCALLPRKLHSSWSFLATGGKAGPRQLERLGQGLCCPLVALEFA